MGEVSCLLLLPVAGYLDSRYTCCGGDIGTPGCAMGEVSCLLFTSSGWVLGQ